MLQLPRILSNALYLVELSNRTTVCSLSQQRQSLWDSPSCAFLGAIKHTAETLLGHSLRAVGTALSPASFPSTVQLINSHNRSSAPP